MLSTSKCQCGNSIIIIEYYNTGGVNDQHVVIYQCDKCHKKGYTIVENFDQCGNIKGASLVTYRDSASINIDDYVKEHCEIMKRDTAVPRLVE